MKILFWVAGAWGVLRLLPILLAFLSLLRVKLQPTRYRRIEESEMDPELAQYLRAVAAPLASLGFEEHGFVRIRRTVVSAEDHADLLELRHRESETFAILSAGEAPDRLGPTISFFTRTEPPVLTLNGLAHALIGEYPGAELFDPYSGPLANAAKAHLDRLAGRRGRPGSDDDRLAHAEALDRRYLQSLAESGEVRPTAEPEILELTVKGAFGGARKALAGRVGLRRLALERRAHASEHPELYPDPPLSEEVKAYRRHEELRRSPNRRQTLVVIFGATAVLFALSMTRLFDPMQIGVLVAVIFFHELGHYFAMRVFDYRDTTIFFIPFLGAAATGRKDRPSLDEEMFILLAGPMPGLVLGLGLLFVPELRSSEAGHFAILTLVGINLFNLLPIFPLDGGRIVHALLFAGRPWLDAASKLLAVLTFAALGLWSEEYVMVVIAVLLVFAVPLGFRTSRIEADFRAEERIERPSDAVRWIFARLRTGRADRPLAFHQKLALARQLEQRLAHAPGRWSRTIPWLALYAGCIVAGIVVLAVSTMTFR